MSGGGCPCESSAAASGSHRSACGGGERRCAHPLVSTGMLARRSILLTNIATMLVETGLYFAFLGLTGFVRAPVRSGFELRRHGHSGGQRGVPPAGRSPAS